MKKTITHRKRERSFSTPMMQQYVRLKKKYPNCILLFRLGDFYELFLEDAEVGAELLDITLTARPRGKDGKIPMAGVPYHALDTHLPKLTRAGYKVAICEQQHESDGKTLVERDVVRIISPGTILNESALHANQHNYILSIAHVNSKIAIGLSDVSTGTLKVSQLHNTQDLESIVTNITTQYQPKELLINPQFLKQNPTLESLIHRFGITVFDFENWEDTIQKASSILKKHFKTTSLKHFQLHKKPAAQGVAAILIAYLTSMQKTTINHITQVEPLLSTTQMELDRSTIINLELIETLYDGQKNGSLLKIIDYTHTALGARKLRDWLLRPLTDQQAITDRHDVISWFHDRQAILATTRKNLKKIRDIERLTSRLTLNQGSPKDIIGIVESLEAIEELLIVFDQEIRKDTKKLPPLLDSSLAAFEDSALKKIQTTIRAELVEEPPFDPKQGRLILSGVDAQIDSLRECIDTNRSWMAAFEHQEKERTGIPSLKVRFNKVFGFYIEISKSYLQLVPSEYMRRQTLVNAERFITPEMKQREDIILTAEQEIQGLEYQRFCDLVNKITHTLPSIQKAAQSIAILDCLMGFAQLALAQNYCRPKLTTKRIISLTKSRHPVVETMITHEQQSQSSGVQFIPNDILLNQEDRQLLLLTGPNMAGKSVLMRQVALTTLLAQIGSFVPASEATIGVVDRIFVRSGASDMISEGFSTFMVEMTETATILNNTTNNSLIIMDEIGRGTSTYDGISIAWAIAEFLVELGRNRPLTLFATHYHELQELAQKYPDTIANAHMAVSRQNTTPIFLYQLQDGAAEHSFGIEVAKLAGVDTQVTKRAETLLASFDAQKHIVKTKSMYTNNRNTHIEKKAIATPTTYPKEIRVPTHKSSVETKLKKLSLERTTPLQALNLLAELKKMIE